MKKLTLLFILMIALTAISFTQEEYKISDVTVSSGRGALSSGIFGSINVIGNNNRLIFEVEKDFAQAMYGKQMGDFFVAGSGGFFQNTPWVGPYIVFSKSVFTLVSWNGIAAGQANDPQLKLKFIFAFHSIRVDIKPFYLNYAVISFQQDRVNNLPGAGIVIPVGDKVTCSVGGDYTLRDKKPLFGASLNYKL